MNDTEDRSSRAQRFSQAHKERAKGMMRDRNRRAPKQEGSGGPLGPKFRDRPDKRGPQRGAEVKKDYAGPQRPRQVQAPDQEGGGQGGRKPGRGQHRATIKERIQAMRARKQERRQARG
jgi:hypothetical protein